MKPFLKKITPKFVFSAYYIIVEFLVALYYGFPGKKLRVIGVTGTKGKSSVVYLASRVFEEAGFKVGATSSIEFKLGKKAWTNKTKMTMPGRKVLQRFLYDCVKQKIDYVILEVTSEALAQNRHKFISFETAVFTNIFPEHIESHGSFEKYKQAKGRLFSALNGKGNAIVNTSYKESDYFLNCSTKKINKLLFKNTDKLPFVINLLGDFNYENAIAVYNIAKAYKIKNEIIKKAIQSIKFIPGRIEFIDMGQNFKIYIDYAHMPSALEKVLKTLKPKKSKLIVITGSAGGGRDKWKRPEMGRIAAQYGNIVIITNEDPYKDNPWQIIENVYAGAEKALNKLDHKAEIIKILDREFAIKKALSMAKKEDVVVITGKGREPWMETARGKISWSDAGIVEKVLKK